MRVGMECRPDRVLRLLTTLASVAYFGTCVGAVLVLVGAPALKLLAPADVGWEWGLPVPVTAEDADATVLTNWGPARLDVEDVRGHLRLPIAMLPWWLFAVLWTHAAVVFALAVTFLHHLRRLFERARDGAPFDAGNAPRLSRLGLTLFQLAMVNGIVGSFTSVAVSWTLTSDDITVRTGLHLNWWLIFFALVLAALSQMFRRGTELEEEQSLIV